MDIKDKVAPEDKEIVAKLFMEYRVLGNLLQERNALLETKAREILAKQGLSYKQYNFKFDIEKDIWESQLKEGALIIPNRETRRAIERRHN